MDILHLIVRYTRREPVVFLGKIFLNGNSNLFYRGNTLRVYKMGSSSAALSNNTKPGVSNDIRTGAKTVTKFIVCRYSAFHLFMHFFS